MQDLEKADLMKGAEYIYLGYWINRMEKNPCI